MKAVLSSDLVIATSLLCEGCCMREETCEKVTIKYFRRLGWKKISDKVLCPQCVAKKRS